MVTWAMTVNLNYAGQLHATSLLSDGRVLVIGGLNDENSSLKGAEFYDPSRNTYVR